MVEPNDKYKDPGIGLLALARMHTFGVGLWNEHISK
jgi:hypothetical protein